MTLRRIRNKTDQTIILFDLQRPADTFSLLPYAETNIDIRFEGNLDLTKIKIISGPVIGTGSEATPPSMPSYPISVSKYSMIATQDVENKFLPVEVPENSLIGRLDGEITTILIEDIRGTPKHETYYGSLTPDSMTWASFPFTPDPSSIILEVNGIGFNEEAFTVVGKLIIATTAVNEFWGGSGTDGKGFSNTDRIKAFYIKLD